MSATLFFHNVKTLRQNAKLSAAKVSQGIPVDIQIYLQIEEGKYNPDITTLIALSSFYNVSIDKLLTHNLSERNIVQRDNFSFLRNKVKTLVYDYFGFTQKEIETPTKGKKEKYECRQISAYFMFCYNLGSIKAIGQEIKRDHTCTLHAIRVVRKLYEVDPIYKNNITNLDERVKEIIDFTSKRN